jgi:hypothetical protein
MNDFFKQENTKAVAIVVILVILAFGTQWSCSRYMRSAAVKVLGPLNAADSIQNSLINTALTGTTSQIATLKQQYLICNQIKLYYRALGTTYYVNYYAFSICSIIFTTLLTISAFLIGHKGWQTSSIILKSFLATTVVLSSFYYFLPNVLGNKQNLKENMDKVKVMSKIQFDILSLSHQLPSANHVKIDSAIASYYSRISSNIEFITTIDDSSLNSDVKKLLEGYETQTK